LIIIKKEQFKKARKEMPKRKAQRDFENPVSLSYGHILDTPFHNFLQKVRG
jgi:hypothetical protein